MEEYASAHRKVIEAIHKSFYNGTPFAMWEIRNLSGVSTSSVRRTVGRLVDLKLVYHAKKAHAGKHYRVTKHWPVRLADAFETYEFAKIVGL